MNFKEALDELLAGKVIERNGRIVLPMPGDPEYLFKRDDMTATDWTVHEKKVEITMRDLENAWEKSGREIRSTVLKDLGKELGLV